MSDINDLEPYARALEAIHKLFKPHAAQLEPGRDIFSRGVRRIFLRFSRQVGKSQLCAYIAVRWALTHPGSQIFIMAPLLVQVRGLYLHTDLLKGKCPPEFPVEVNIADGRFTFPNGSTIRLLGADNVESVRGLTADLFILDELKDIKSWDAAWAVIGATLMARRAPLILAGTPPGQREHFYWSLLKEFEEDADARVYKARTVDNPYIDPKDVEKERKKYEARGDINTWLREFEAEYAVDTKRAVFPMFSRERHVKPYEQMLYEVWRKPSHWEFVASCDPAHASTFAILFTAINRHDGRVRFFDELYIKDQALTSIGAVWPLAQAKMREIHPDDDDNPWVIVMDEAATGVRVELLDTFDVAAIPTQKAQNRKSYGTSLLKDLYLEDKLHVSDRCKNFVAETENYFLSEAGEYVKKDDHLCSDCARYALHATGYTAKPSEPAPDPKEMPYDERPRGYRPSDDLAAMNYNDTPVYSFESPYDAD